MPKDTIDENSEALKKGMRDAGGAIFNGIIDVTKFIQESLGGVADTIGSFAANAGLDGFNSSSDGGGSALTNELSRITGEAMGNMIKASKFFTDPEFRENEAIPELRAMLNDNREILSKEMKESPEALDLLTRLTNFQSLDGVDFSLVLSQLPNLLTSLPALAGVLVSSGILLLPSISDGNSKRS